MGAALARFSDCQITRYSGYKRSGSPRASPHPHGSSSRRRRTHQRPHRRASSPRGTRSARLRRYSASSSRPRSLPRSRLRPGAGPENGAAPWPLRRLLPLRWLLQTSSSGSGLRNLSRWWYIPTRRSHSRAWSCCRRASRRCRSHGTQALPESRRPRWLPSSTRSSRSAGYQDPRRHCWQGSGARPIRSGSLPATPRRCRSCPRYRRESCRDSMSEGRCRWLRGRFFRCLWRSGSPCSCSRGCPSRNCYCRRAGSRFSCTRGRSRPTRR